LVLFFKKVPLSLPLAVGGGHLHTWAVTKKKQKAVINLASASPERLSPDSRKFFASFFSKKQAFFPSDRIVSMTAEQLVRAYYDAFNAGDFTQMVSLLAEDVIHDINQGQRETGRSAFAAFMERMNASYSERLEDIVVMSEPSGTRAAAEFTVHGTYLKADPGLPPAHGQTYILPAGAFFDISNGKIGRVTNFYNLENWLAQVRSADAA
jgi:steroid delta-isomerase-like uncharacterized protein